MKISNISFNPNSSISSTDLNTLKNIFDSKINLINDFIFSDGGLIYGSPPVVYNDLFFVPIINVDFNILKNIKLNSTIFIEKSNFYGRYISYYVDEYTNILFIVLYPINNSYVLNGDKLFYNDDVFAEVDLFNNYFIGSILYFDWSIYYFKNKFIELKNYFKIINPYYNDNYNNVYLVVNEIEYDKNYDFNENEYGIFYDDYFTSNSYFYYNVDIILTLNSTVIKNGIKIGEILNNNFVSTVNDYNSVFIKKIWDVIGNKILSNYAISVDLLNKKIKINNLNYLHNGHLYFNKLKYIDFSKYYESYSKNNFYYNLFNKIKFSGNLQKINISPTNTFVWLFDENNHKVGCARILDADDDSLYLYNVLFFSKIKFSTPIILSYSPFSRINDGLFFIDTLSIDTIIVYSKREIFLFENINNNNYQISNIFNYNPNNVKTIKTQNQEIIFNVSSFEFSYISGDVEFLDPLEELNTISSIRYPIIKEYSLTSNSSGILIIPENFNDLNNIYGLLFNSVGNYKKVEIKEGNNSDVYIDDSFVSPNTNYSLKIIVETTESEVYNKKISIFKLIKNNFGEYALPIKNKNCIIKISPELDKLYTFDFIFNNSDIGNYIIDNKGNKIFKIIDVISPNTLVVLKLNGSEIKKGDFLYYNDNKIKIFDYEYYESIDLSNLNFIRFNEYENDSFVLFTSDLELSNYYALVYYSDDLFSVLNNKICLNYKRNNINVFGGGIYDDPYYVIFGEQILFNYINQTIRNNFLYQDNYLEIDFIYKTIDSRYINLAEDIYLDTTKRELSLGDFYDYIDNNKEIKNDEEKICVIKIYNTEGFPRRENLILSDYNLIEVKSSTENEDFLNIYYINLNFEKINLTMTNNIFKTNNEFYYRFYGKNIDENITGIKIPRIASIGTKTYTPLIGEVIKDNLENLYKVDTPDCTFYEYNPYTNNQIVNTYTATIDYIVLYPISINNYDFSNVNKLYNIYDNSKYLNVLDFSILKDKYNNIEYFLYPKENINLENLYSFDKFISFEIKCNVPKKIFGFNFYCQFFDGGVVYFEINNQKILVNKTNYKNNKIELILNTPIIVNKGDIIFLNIYPNDSVNFIWCEKIYLDNYIVGEVYNNLFTNNKRFIKFDVLEIEFSNNVINKTFDINFPETKKINKTIIEFQPQKILLYLEDFDISDIPTTIYIDNIKNNKKIKYLGGDIVLNNLTPQDLAVDYIPVTITPYNSPLSSLNPGFLYYKENIISFTGVDYINYKILNCKLIGPGSILLESGDYIDYYMFGNIPGFTINKKNFTCTNITKTYKHTLLELSSPGLNFSNEKIFCYDLIISNKMMFNYYINENPKMNIKIIDGVKEDVIKSKEGVLNNYYGENIKINLFNHYGVYDCYENNIILKTVKPYKIKGYKNFFKKYINIQLNENYIYFKFKKLNNYTKIYLYDIYNNREISNYKIILEENYKIIKFDMSQYINKLFEGYLIIETNSYYSEVFYE